MNTLEADSARSQFCNIMDYGAVNDGLTVNTPCIQQAIDDCAGKGGGTVYFPSGTFISGTLFLKSHVSLHLDAGAILRGSKEVADYPVTIPKGMPKDISFSRSLIYGEGLTHVAITGHGIIDGHSEAFFQDLQALRESDYMAWRKLRPFNVRIVDCEHVVIKDVTLMNACAWCLHCRGCRNVHIRGMSLNNRRKGVPNADGIDLDGCQNVRISDCDITSSDDALVIFGSNSENISITNCYLSSHCHAFKMYGSGVFRNLCLSNCIIQNTNRAGISLQMTDACTLDNLSVSNIIMDKVNCPLWIQQVHRPGYEPEGRLSNIHINNLQATNADSIGCAITGMPVCPVSNVTLSNIRIAFEGGGTKDLADKAIGELPEHDESVFGRHLTQRTNNHNQFGMLPAYGFFCRHVDRLVMDNLNLSTASADCRPAVLFRDARDSRLSGLQAAVADGADSLVVIDQSRNLVINECGFSRKIAALTRIANDSTNIHIIKHTICG